MEFLENFSAKEIIIFGIIAIVLLVVFVICFIKTMAMCCGCMMFNSAMGHMDRSEKRFSQNTSVFHRDPFSV